MRNNEMSSNRINWIDIAKGIAIILVIIGHAIPEYNLKNNIAEKVIYSMHMPLFFILSGLVFKVTEKTKLKEFAIKRIKQLMIPYIIFVVYIFVCHFCEKVILKNGNDFF